MSMPMIAPSAEQARPNNRAPLYALVAANAISFIGNALAGIAIPWFVLQTTGSAALTGVAAFANTLPLVLGSVFGGALADRIGHKRTSILADVLSGLTVAAIPLLWQADRLSYGPLLLLIFLGALFDTPGNTARTALAPEIAKRAGMRLEQINATFSTIERGSLLVGPPLAGALIAAFGASNVLLIDALTFAVSALLVGALIPALQRPARSEAHYLADVLSGFRFIFGSKLLRTVVLTATITNFLISPTFGVIMPVYISTTDKDATKLGLLIAAFGAGSVVGTILYGAWGHRVSRRALFVVGFGGLAGSIAILATLPPLWVMIAALSLGGFLSGPLNPQIGTFLQERTPPDMLARVIGTLVAAATAAMPLSMLLAGVLIETIGVQATLVWAAGGAILLALSLVINPTLHELDTPHTPPPSAEP